MKTTKITFLSIIILVIAACSASRKGSNSISSATPSSPNTSSPSILLPRGAGLHAPREEELTAIKRQYNDVTLDQLKAGHAIYTQGACISCHGSINIYRYTELQWPGIIDDMSLRAKLSSADKDAVQKYILAIKATQPK